MNSTILSKKAIKLGKSEFDKMLRPNWIFFIDYAGKIGRNTVLHRFVIEMHGERDIAVREFRYNIPHAPYPCMTLTHKSFKSLKDAIEKVEQLSNVRELDGFYYVGKESCKYVDIFSSAPSLRRMTGLAVNQLENLDLGSLCFQKVEGGQLCYLKIDASGKVSLHDINHVGRAVGEKNIITPSLKCFTDRLKQLKYFRGAFIEGVVLGDSFTVLDAGYINNNNLENMAFSERVALINNILHEVNAVEFGVTMAPTYKLESLSKIDPSSFYIVRSEKSGFCQYQRYDGDVTGVIADECFNVEVLDDNGDIRVCSIDDTEYDELTDVLKPYIPVDWEEYSLGKRNGKELYF